MAEMDPRAQALMPRISPTRAYISGALADLGNAVRVGGVMQGLGHQYMQDNQLARAQALQAQQEIEREQQQRQLLERLRAGIGAAGLDPLTTSMAQAYPETFATEALGAAFGSSPLGTSDQQNFTTWSQMPEGPEKDAFGRAAGLLPTNDGGPVGAPQRLANGNLGLVMPDGSVVDTQQAFFDQDVAKRRAESVDELTGLYEDAFRAKEIANRFETMAPRINSGVAGWAGEAVKSALGTQDDVSLLRANYNEFLNQQVVKALPPGPASDRDISMFRSGFPDDTNNPEQIRLWLNGRAKALEAQARVREHRLEFFNGGGKMADWPKEMRRFLEGLSGEVFQPAPYDDLPPGAEVIEE